MKIIYSTILFISLIITSCSQKEDIFTNNINNAVKPGDDFYEYAVGGWLAKNSIPEDYSRWGTFEMLAEKNSEVLKKILDKTSSELGKQSSLEDKIGIFYKLGMDTNKINSLGYSPIQEQLTMIDYINTKEDFIKSVAYMHINISSPLFYFYASPDSKNSEMMIAGTYQGGLGLPDRDYYVNEDGRSVEIREKYLAHLEMMFGLIGYTENDAIASANKVMEIETELAQNSLTRTEARDPIKTYNKMTIDELISIAPEFDWKLFLTEIDMENLESLNVSMPGFMTAMSKIVEKYSVEDWKKYLQWNLLNASSAYLSSEFEQADFDFYQKFLSGIQEMKPRWKRVLSITNRYLGELLGQIYVKDNFPPEAKEKAVEIVDNLLLAMKERIESVDWMSNETKEKALKKLANFTVKIGYPDEWKDYSNLEIFNDSYIQNVFRANKFEFQQDMAKVGKPVDKSEWYMSPQTVNAYYNPLNNEIVFPAAILQSPFFDVNADDAVNYGAMGAVIGHEITHGFDDQGRMFDEKGNLNDWWKAEDAEKFNEKAMMIVDQFNQYIPIDSININGELTQGENIADLGGLTVSFTAFKYSEQYKSNEIIEGFTPTQRFFLSWANGWKNLIRDENLKLRLKTDVHSPGKYRVLGPLSNIDEFYSAFNVTEENKMFRKKEERLIIW